MTNKSKSSVSSTKSHQYRRSRKSKTGPRKSKKGSKVFNSDNSKENLKKMDMTALTTATDLFCNQTVSTLPLDTDFIVHLEFLCEIFPFPIEIIQLLKTAGFNNPHKLINQFGGSINALAQQLCFM